MLAQFLSGSVASCARPRNPKGEQRTLRRRPDWTLLALEGKLVRGETRRCTFHITSKLLVVVHVGGLEGAALSVRGFMQPL